MADGMPTGMTFNICFIVDVSCFLCYKGSIFFSKMWVSLSQSAKKAVILRFCKENNEQWQDGVNGL